MTKLIVGIEAHFEFTPLLAMDDDHGMIPLVEKKIVRLIENAVDFNYSLSAVMFNRSDEFDSVMFEFPMSTLKKGGLVNIRIDPKNGMVFLEIKGELSTKPLRSGVALKIESYGSAADLRLESFFYKGGEWSGFKAPLLDINAEDSNSWPKLTDWRFK
jgi:hypothetical protein